MVEHYECEGQLTITDFLKSKVASQKAIESGKNAERCRKYYWRKKGLLNETLR